MSTQPIGHKGYGYTLKQSRKPREDVDFPLGPEQSKKRQDESGEQRGDGLRARIRALLADVSTDGGSGISFQDILDHREMLERDWGDRMERDLRGLGVDMTRVFRLVNDPAAGSVTAGADHPDKMKIDQYFASNSEMVEDFERVLQLGKLSDTALRKLTVDEMGQELSVEPWRGGFSRIWRARPCSRVAAPSSAWAHPHTRVWISGYKSRFDDIIY